MLRPEGPVIKFATLLLGAAYPCCAPTTPAPQATKSAAAVQRRVLRGGDGGSFKAAAAPAALVPAPAAAPMMMRKMAAMRGPPGGMPAAAMAYGMSADHAVAYGAPPGGANWAAVPQVPATPGLAFAKGAALVTLLARGGGGGGSGGGDDGAAEGVRVEQLPPGDGEACGGLRLSIDAAALERLVGAAVGAAAGAGALLREHGFTEATAAAWVPWEPRHASVARSPVAGAGAGDAAADAPVRDVGLLRPEPEEGAVYAQVRRVGG
jgi:hypothetical protein